MLLIHDLSDHKDEIEELFPQDTKIFSKDINNIHPCLGCFKCWVKTPGVCVIKDSYTEMPKYIKSNDKLVIISELRYGSYSPYIKKVIERSIGFLLPFFRLIDGEVHHSIRYKDIPKFYFIGYSDSITEDEEKTFRNLVKGNAINFGVKEYKAFVANNFEDMKNIIQSI